MLGECALLFKQLEIIFLGLAAMFLMIDQNIEKFNHWSNAEDFKIDRKVFRRSKIKLAFGQYVYCIYIKALVLTGFFDLLI